MKKKTCLSYRARLVAVYCVTILILVLVVTWALVTTSSRQAEKDGKSHLSLLTQQVLVNFSNAAKTAEQQVLTMLDSTGATEQLDRMRNLEENGAGYYQYTQDLVYALNRMITTQAYYSELYVRLDGGRSFSTPRGAAFHTQRLLAGGGGRADPHHDPPAGAGKRAGTRRAPLER